MLRERSLLFNQRVIAGFWLVNQTSNLSRTNEWIISLFFMLNSLFTKEQVHFYNLGFCHS